MTDISGVWMFNEDFHGGKSSGEIELDQTEDNVNAILNVTESDDEGQLIQVRIHMKGSFDNNWIKLTAVNAIITNGPVDTTYCLDTYEGCLNSEGKIVGSSIDEQGTCGIFVMEREN